MIAANANDGENDNITPKLRGKNKSCVPGADAPPMVTPHESEKGPTGRVDASGSSPEGERNIDGGENDGGSSPSSITKNETPRPRETAEASTENGSVPTPREAAAPTQHVYERQRDQRTWDQMQVPQRARQQQDRRGWEQMQLKFQRVERMQTQQVLSAVDDGVGYGRNDATRHEEEITRRSSTMTSSARSDRAAGAERPNVKKVTRAEISATRRQSKRQKRRKQDVASFLDSFAFGSTKQPNAESKDSGSEYDSNEEESERNLRCRRSWRRSPSSSPPRRSTASSSTWTSSSAMASGSRTTPTRRRVVAFP